MKKIAFITLCSFFSLVSCSDDNGTNTNSDDFDPIGATFILQNAFPNLSFSRPVDFQNPGDNSNRIFVVEQGGIIRVFENSENATTSEIFLDISSLVNTNANEQGLLGLAFHPNFQIVISCQI